jgi:hypothetical protein
MKPVTTHHIYNTLFFNNQSTTVPVRVRIYHARMHACTWNCCVVMPPANPIRAAHYVGSENVVKPCGETLSTPLLSGCARAWSTPAVPAAARQISSSNHGVAAIVLVFECFIAQASSDKWEYIMCNSVYGVTPSIRNNNIINIDNNNIVARVLACSRGTSVNAAKGLLLCERKKKAQLLVHWSHHQHLPHRCNIMYTIAMCFFCIMG